MTLSFAFRKIQATEALKDKISKKVQKFRKYVTYPIAVHVTLSLERTFQCAEITCHAEHRELVAVAKTKNLYESIDAVVQKIQGQLRKERERKKGHASGHVVLRKTAVLAADVPADIPHRVKKLRQAR